MSPLIKLGVNIDHIATLREVRKAKFPDLIRAAILCRRGGADQITVHLREDRRHIQDRDVIQLLRWGKLPVNLEMAFTREMLKLAAKWRPQSVTLVPERRAEMTTESGLDLSRLLKYQKALGNLKSQTQVYGFIDPDLRQVELARILDLQGIEFHTGTFAEVFDQTRGSISQKKLRAEVQRLYKAASFAADLGLEVKAGHGLTTRNMSLLLGMPLLSEVNIGHFIVCQSVFVGLENAVREMKAVL